MGVCLVIETLSNLNMRKGIAGKKNCQGIRKHTGAYREIQKRGGARLRGERILINQLFLFNP